MYKINDIPITKKNVNSVVEMMQDLNSTAEDSVMSLEGFEHRPHKQIIAHIS